jgi:hypothetical protein
LTRRYRAPCISRSKFVTIQPTKSTFFEVRELSQSTPTLTTVYTKQPAIAVTGEPIAGRSEPKNGKKAAVEGDKGADAKKNSGPKSKKP